MSKIKQLLVLVASLLLAVSTSWAQATLTSTTLSAAMTSTSDTAFRVTSATGFTVGQLAYVNREAISITSVSGITINGQRGANGTRSSTHASGATIYVGPPNYFTSFDRAGSCTSTDELVLPRVNTVSGNIFQCTASLWVITNGPASTATGLTALGPNAAGTIDVGSATLPFRHVYFAGTSGTPGTNNFRTAGASTSGTRVITFPDAAITVPGTVVADCSTSAACSSTTISSNSKVVTGSVALVSASPSAATVTALSPAFTSSTSYRCSVTPVGTTAAIAAGGVAISYVSGTSFTLTGPNTVTTVMNYVCIGN